MKIFKIFIIFILGLFLMFFTNITSFTDSENIDQLNIKTKKMNVYHNILEERTTPYASN